MAGALALIHGFTGGPASWSAALAALTEGLGAPPRAVTPRLLGHAGCPRQRPLPGGFEAEVDAIAEELSASRGGQRYHLAGYSLGGRLALGLLVRHPGLFASATLIGAHYGLDSDADRRERVAADERWCELLEQQGLDAFVERWAALPLFASQASAPSAARRAQERTRREHDPRGLAASLRTTGLGHMPCYLPELAEVAQPVTLITGSLDAKFEALAGAMLEHASRWRHTVVPGAGHNLLLEAPDAVARAITEQVRE